MAREAQAKIALAQIAPGLPASTGDCPGFSAIAAGNG